MAIREEVLPSPSEVAKKYVDINTAAKLLNVHHRTVRSLLKRGEFNSKFFIIAGKYFIEKKAILKFKKVYKKGAIVKNK